MLFDIPGGTSMQGVEGQTYTREQARRGMLLTEMFHLVAGKIERIEVVMRNTAFGAGSGWPSK